LLTYADTRGIITKSDVALMIENKQKNIEFIVSKEKNHNGDIALDHIHSYLNYVDGPINSRNLRYFDVEYPPEANQPFPSNHPNIRYIRMSSTKTLFKLIYKIQQIYHRHLIYFLKDKSNICEKNHLEKLDSSYILEMKFLVYPQHQCEPILKVQL